MSIPHQDLSNAGVDVAGIITEEFLNDFSASHHRVQPDIYKGFVRRDDFGPILEIYFHVAKPIRFDLSPIAGSKFKPIWKRHLELTGYGSLPAIADEVPPPPNAKLFAEAVIFGIGIVDQNTGNYSAKVEFVWDVDARCAIKLMEIDGGYTIQLEPVKIQISKKPTLLLSEIRAALKVSNDGFSGAVPLESLTFDDGKLCLELEKLILILFNGILTTQMSNFVRSWRLPKAVELFDGISIKPNFLSINDNQLIIGAQILSQPLGSSGLQAVLDELMGGYADQIEMEFGGMSDDEFLKWTPESSSSLAWLRDKRDQTEKRVLELASSMVKSVSGPNMHLLFNSEPVDIIAKKFLRVEQGWNGEKKLDRAIKAEIGWWFRTENPSGRVINKGIQIQFTPNVGGKARVCHFDFDPKNFGGWKCYGPCVNLAFKDLKVNAFPSFESSGVYLRAMINSKGVSISFCDFPSWANDILGWVTAKLTEPIIDALGVAISLFKFKIVKYPAHFPGTALEWVPNVSSRPSNAGEYLVISARADFK